MFTADVAVEDQDEIAMLAHSQGTFRKVVDFRIDTTTAPAVGLSRVPPKTTKSTCTLHIYVRARELVHFVFGLQLENHAELNTKTTSVVITRAKGTGCSRKKMETSILN